MGNVVAARIAREVKRTIRSTRIHSSGALMTSNSTSQALQDRIVCGWLFAIAALIAVMVLVGGATRLTQSGLSIVEWKPVMGVVPPLGEIGRASCRERV